MFAKYVYYRGAYTRRSKTVLPALSQYSKGTGCLEYWYSTCKNVPCSLFVCFFIRRGSEVESDGEGGRGGGRSRMGSLERVREWSHDRWGEPLDIEDLLPDYLLVGDIFFHIFIFIHV